MDPQRSARLHTLADDTLSLIYELQRLQRMGLETADQEAEIQTNIEQLEGDLAQLEELLKANEDSGHYTTDQLKGQEDLVIDLVKKLESLHASSGNPRVPPRDVLFYRQPRSDNLSTQGDAAADASRALSPTRADGVDTTTGSALASPTSDNVQLVQLQQRIVEEQDRNLDALSQSVRRQRELGISMHNELDTHIQLLDETDQAADRTAGRLNFAQRRLHDFEQSAQRTRSCYCTLVLIVLLIIVVALLRLL
ncbi:hypothetical protein H4R35_004875 [Dimargaris xerosporica]|nr:hypothetical protein H4R35_004875 [Dimargaris xerosporica]